jgi:hypothetical protein
MQRSRTRQHRDAFASDVAAGRADRGGVSRGGHRRGTEIAATLYTVIETAKLHNIDPAAYLRAAIIAADRGELLLPS